MQQATQAGRQPRSLRRTSLGLVLAVVAVTASIGLCRAQEYLTGIEWQEPPVIEPGKSAGDPPSDAVILFDGKNFDAWKDAETWKIEGDTAVVGKNYIETKRHFGDSQLHVEWTAPTPPKGRSQGRGNSGVFFGDYELQVLDSFDNDTYYDGQAAKGGVLSRRIHRLVTPRFKEESKMKPLIVPLLLLTATAAQLIRIERVGAESVTNSSRSNVEETSAIVDGAIVKTTAATEVAAERDADFDALAKLPYKVEPTDILLIEILNFTPQAPRPLEKSDTVLVRVEGASPEQPIDYACNVDADGAIDLGPTHGRVRIVDLTVEESEAAIRDALSKTLSKVKVSVWMPDTAGGQYLVQADGRITLDALGSVSVAGMTLDDARKAIERKLAEKLKDPDIFVAVLSANSKVVYVIDERIDGYHYVSRLPVPFPLSTDCNVDSALEHSARRDYKLSEARITLCRPAPNGKGEERVFPIACDPSTDLITRETNHSLLPGDRIFVTPPGVLAAATQYASPYASPPGYRDSNSHATPQPAVATQYEGHAATYVAAPAAPQAARATPKVDPPATPADDSVDFKITVLEDPDDHLAEFEALHNGFMLDERGTVCDALRLLEKNGLVKCVASPQLTSRLGETCEMRMDSPGAEKGGQLRTGFAVSVCARRVYTKLLIEVQMDRQVDGKGVAIDTRAKLESGQTIIVAAKGRPAKSEGEAIKPRTYLVLTPTLVE